MAVSIDGGNTFSPFVVFSAATASATGVTRNYFYGANSTGGPFLASLFVHSIDLSSFGVPLGMTVDAVRLGSGQQVDLIRVAGFQVPEPRVATMLAVAIVGVAVIARRRRHRAHLRAPTAG
jgi:hypothetical protein